MQFNQILTDLMVQHEITAYKLWKETKIPQSVIGKWKAGTQKPNGESLQKLADYFNVSVDFLLGSQQKTSPSEDELVLMKLAQADEDTKAAVTLLKQLNPKKFAQALDYLNYLANKEID